MACNLLQGVPLRLRNPRAPPKPARLQVGMFDGTVRVLSLDPDSTLKVLATQVRQAAAWGL